MQEKLVGSSAAVMSTRVWHTTTRWASTAGMALLGATVDEQATFMRAVQFAGAACDVMDRVVWQGREMVRRGEWSPEVERFIKDARRMVTVYDNQWHQWRAAVSRASQPLLEQMNSSWNQAGSFTQVMEHWGMAKASGNDRMAAVWCDMLFDDRSTTRQTRRGLSISGTPTRFEFMFSTISLLEDAATHISFEWPRVRFWINPAGEPARWRGKTPAPWPMRPDDLYWQATFNVAGVVAEIGHPRHARLQRVRVTIPQD